MRLKNGQDFSFAERTNNYITSIFAFAGGHDNFVVQCSGGSCSIRVNRQDDYADPQDISNLRHDGSKYKEKSNKYGTPFQFGITCECGDEQENEFHNNEGSDIFFSAYKFCLCLSDFCKRRD